MVQLCKKLDKSELPIFLSVNKDRFIGEVKEDGDRCRMRIKDKQITLSNRRGNDVTSKYPEFNVEANLPDMFIDGEMCVLDKNEISQFNAGISFRSHCKNQDTIRSKMGEYPVTFVMFDILECDGEDLREKTTTERREILEVTDIPYHVNNTKIVEQATTPEEIIGLWDHVTSLGGEGLILKDKSAPYKEGKRVASWLKVKDVHEQVLTFRTYTRHNAGIRVETKDGIAITVNGTQAEPIAEELNVKGETKIEIRHLGYSEESNRFRQPVFFRRV